MGISQVLSIPSSVCGFTSSSDSFRTGGMTTDDYEALVDEACKAWRRLTAEAGRIKVALQLPVDYEGQNLRWMVLFSSPPRGLSR
jgi:hypothetical protein